MIHPVAATGVNHAAMTRLCSPTARNTAEVAAISLQCVASGPQTAAGAAPARQTVRRGPTDGTELGARRYRIPDTGDAGSGHRRRRHPDTGALTPVPGEQKGSEQRSEIYQEVGSCV